MRLHPRPAARPGFTLIEILVAAGLCLLIMSVLAAAFAAGIDTFSLLKSTGELNGRLETAQALLRYELQQPHLESDSGEAVKVSQLRFDRIGQSADRFSRPQPFGYFRVAQDIPLAVPASAPPQVGGGVAVPVVATAEGLDPDLVPSSRATGHSLVMAVRLSGTRIDKAATAKLPVPDASFTAAENNSVSSAQSATLANLDPSGSRFTSQWYEVAYFLNPNSTGLTAVNVGGQTLPLYSFHRRARPLLPNDAQSLGQIDWTTFNKPAATPADLPRAAPGLSSRPVIVPGPPATKKYILNTVADAGDPSNRLGGFSSNRFSGLIEDLTPLGTGEDILLTNVISFEVRFQWDAPTAAPQLAMRVVGDFPFEDLPGFPSPAASATAPNGVGNPNFLRVDPNNPGVTAGVPAGVPSLRVFDTWTAGGNFQTWDQPTKQNAMNPALQDPNPAFVPLPIRLKAIQIKIRLYDPKNKLTRQVTTVQDL